MGFKLKPPYSDEEMNTPVYRVDEEDGINGRANKNGTITLNNKLNPNEEENTISHEMTHVKQFKDFNESEGKKGLDYSDDHISWNGKNYKRKNGKIFYEGKWRPEGWPKFPWEEEAYNNETPIT